MGVAKLGRLIPWLFPVTGEKTNPCKSDMTCTESLESGRAWSPAQESDSTASHSVLVQGWRFARPEPVPYAKESKPERTLVQATQAYVPPHDSLHLCP